MKKYVVRCLGCSSECDQHAITCPSDPHFLRAEYSAIRLTPRDLPGMWKFLDWLPTNDIIPALNGRSVTYRSEGFASEVSIKHLFVSFNGYWPERNALFKTCSFKELEAAPTVRRLIERGKEGVLVVASAGNTGRAFAHACSVTGRPLALVVPASAMNKIWLPGEGSGHETVCTIAVDGDYTDAIVLGEQLACLEGFVPEGGARNIARRDGMGTVMLEAALTIGRMPDRYVQAVGSATGAIAAWEASMRLIRDGRFGSAMPVLDLAQNLPCAPILAALNDVMTDPACPKGMYDEVLFNRRPPITQKGGVVDALRSTHGSVQGITNDEAERARKLFERAEGVDIMPAAAIAVAALVKSAESGSIGPEDIVLLNITGGGERLLRAERGVTQLPFDLKVKKAETDVKALASDVQRELRRCAA